MTAKETAMSDLVADPLLLGQRVIAILETGQRDATYKLATLMASLTTASRTCRNRPTMFSVFLFWNWRIASSLCTGRRFAPSKAKSYASVGLVR